MNPTPNPIKILHITTERAWRGGENQLLQLLRGSSDLPLQHMVVVQPNVPMKERFAPFARIYTVSMRNDLDIFAALKIAKICREQSIAIIHTHTARGHSLGLVAKAILRLHYSITIRLVVHRRVEPSKHLSWIERWKYLSDDIDQFICVSKSIASGLENLGVEKKRLQVVYSAVDVDVKKSSEQDRLKIRSQLNLSSNDFVTIFVGSMESQKGVDFLLSGWSALCVQDIKKSSHVPSRLLMVGDGPLRMSLEQASLDERFAGSVQFLGFRTDVYDLLLASDVLILPTLWEGLGTSLLEGLLRGCAVVGSNVGGVPEIILDGKTGLLIPPKDSDAIQSALIRLRDDPHLRSRLVSSGLEHVQATFSISSLVAGHFSIYETLASV